MSIFECFFSVKIMLTYAKILLSRKMPKSLQNMNSKNFDVSSDHSIQKIANKIGIDIDMDIDHSKINFQELTSSLWSNKHMLNKLKI